MNQKFANLGIMLSRSQAKKIVGGAEEDLIGFCAISTNCRLYVQELGQTLDGECYYQIGAKCFCGAGGYVTNPSSTSMCYVQF